MTEAERIAKLELPSHPVHIVIDSDTGCEVDDQFAIAYAIRSAEMGQIFIDAIYAAPFAEKQNGVFVTESCMKRSYEEIGRLIALSKTDLQIPYFQGAPRFMDDGKPIDSPAVQDLVTRAMSYSKEEPLYVVTLGDMVNVASAILLHPEIAEHIVLVTLAGNALQFPYAKEYNIEHGYYAFNTLLSSGAPMILFPCTGVVTHLVTTTYELDSHLMGKSDVAKYLCSLVHHYKDLRKQGEDYAWSKVIWDLAPMAFLVRPTWFLSSLTSAPLLSEDFRWTRDKTRHMIRTIDYFERDPIFADAFEKLGR